MKNQKTCDYQGKGWSTDPNPNIAQMLELLYKDSKAVITTILHDLKVNTVELCERSSAEKTESIKKVQCRNFTCKSLNIWNSSDELNRRMKMREESVNLKTD